MTKLHKDRKINGNKLPFFNNTTADIILKDRFTRMLGDNFINILTREKIERYHHHIIDEAFLKQKISNFKQHFYVCGPDPMIASMQAALKNLRAGPPSAIVV